MDVKLISVIVYLLVLLLIGVVASKRMKSLGDYFAGGKSQGFWVVAFSARATGESAWLLLGLTGMGAMVGAQAFWVVIGETLGVLVAWLFMARRFKVLTDRYDSITIPDYFESRFRDSAQTLRKLAALALVVFVTIYVSAQIDATGKAFENFLGWDYYVGAIVGFAVVLAYIVTGGFVAVAWSDTFQGILMFVGLVGLPILGFSFAGGITPVIEGLRGIDPSMLEFNLGTDIKGFFGVLAMSLIGLGFLGSPQIFVRFIALRSPREIGKGAAVAIAFTVLADGGAVLIGMVGRYLLHEGGLLELGAAGEDVLPMLVDHLVAQGAMPLLVAGIFIAIVLSAIMSTVDSLLVVASSALVRDWYQKVKNPELSDEELVSLSRKVTFALALAALAVSMVVAMVSEDRTVFWFVIFGWSGISATFCPAIILSLAWSGYTRRGAIASMISGFACVPLFKFVAPELPQVGELLAELSELPPSFAIAMIMGVIFSVTDREGRAALGDEIDEELKAIE